MHNKNFTILLILPVTSQPRFIKRVRSYLEKGYVVTVASFERDYFNKNKLPEHINFYPLGKIESGNYLKRIPKLLKSISTLRQLINKNKRVIIFSADILILLSFIIRKNALEYEIGDIRNLKSNHFLISLYRLFYKNSLVRCKKIHVTSEGFKDYLRQNYSVDKSKIEIIENKLNIIDFPESHNIQKVFPLKKTYVLGIIGLLRYDNILKFIEEYIRRAANKFIIKIYGDGPLKDEILEYVDDSTIFYYGQFKYPDDLTGIYDEIDVSFVMYDSNDLNVRLALPNKLYESIYFRRPLIVSSHTFLSRKIEEFKIGFEWDQNEMADLVSYLNSCTFESDFNKLEGNFKNIEQEEYLIS